MVSMVSMVPMISIYCMANQGQQHPTTTQQHTQHVYHLVKHQDLVIQIMVRDVVCGHKVWDDIILWLMLSYKSMVDVVQWSTMLW